MNRFLMGINLILLLSVSGHTSSQESTKTDQAAPQTVSPELETKPQTKPTNSSDEQDSGNAKPRRKVFKPSEEISEDSPVPFPVDI